MSLDIETALSLLPDRPDDIASMLAQEDCWGEAGKVCVCPLALFLTRLTTTQIYVYYRLGHVVINGLSVSSAIHEFVKKFDRGRYPFLEARAAIAQATA